jgi:hypothetical protein
LLIVIVIFIIITFLFHFYPINKRGYSTVSDTLFLTTESYKKSLKIPKGVIRIRKSKDRQHNGQKKRTKGQTTIYKALHITLKIK